METKEEHPGLSEAFSGGSFSTEWQPQVTPTGPSSLFGPIISPILPTTVPTLAAQTQTTNAPKKINKKKAAAIAESANKPDDDQSHKEGSNIHFAADGKKLCSYSHKLCKQRRMEGRSFCIKHILEDPTSGFHQCEYICKKKSGKRCTNPVPNEEGDSQYCSHHRQILGLQPRKSSHKRGTSVSKKRAGARGKEAHYKLLDILAKQGIPPISSKRASIVLPKKSSLNGPEQADDDEVHSASSSDEFPSDEEISDTESELFDGDSFFADTFLNQYEEPDAEHDYLRDAAILTEEETILRRKMKIAKLLKLYKLQYRRLQDILRTRHELYVKRMEKLKEKELAKPEKFEQQAVLSEAFKQNIAKLEKKDEDTEEDAGLKDVSAVSEALPITDIASNKEGEESLSDMLSTGDKEVTEQKLQDMGDVLKANSNDGLSPKTSDEQDKLSVLMQHYPHVKEGKELSLMSVAGEGEKKDKNADSEEAPNCVLRGCKGKCVLLTNYCFAHILQDHNQKLFKGCTYISPEGNKCNFPILVTQKPPICNGHIDLVGGAKRERRKRKASEKKDNEPQDKEKKPKQRKKRKEIAEISSVSEENQEGELVGLAPPTEVSVPAQMGTVEK